MNFRADRAITLGIAAPILKVLPSHEKKHIPILMYHSISESSLPGKHPYFQTHTHPEVFQAQMDLLVNKGFHVIDLNTAVEMIFSGENNQSGCVVITFDDAYEDFMTHAFPVLKNHCFTATVFVPTGMVGGVSERLLNKRCLSWDQLVELSNNGIDIGSHSVTHGKLGAMNRKDLTYEITHSKNEIEDRINRQVLSFSCPYAFPECEKPFLEMYPDILKENGYQLAVSTRIGRASRKDGIYGLKRIPVNTADDQRFFSAKLAGGYDWLRVPQKMVKKIKAMVRKGE